MKKSALAALLLLALSSELLVLRRADAAVKNPDTYNYITISDQDSLDPAWSYDSASGMLIENTYEYLFEYDGPSTEKLLPLLAEKIPTRSNGLLSKDGRVYTLPIRKGVKFHDGTVMTPEDVRYSILRWCLLDRDGGPSSLLLEPLAGYPSTRDEKGVLRENAYADMARAVTVKGDNVVITLPSPFSPVLSILAHWSPVVSKAWVVKGGGWDGTEATWKKFNNPAAKEASPLHDKENGTGPFKLERWDKAQKEVLLARNDAYWRKPAALARVRIKGINDMNLRKLMIENGDADSITADWPDYSKLQNIAGVELIENLPTVEMNPVLYFTTQLDPVANPDMGSGKFDGGGIPADFFSDPDVRRGFAYAFDYDALIKDVYRGRATQATGCIPKSLAGHDSNLKPYTFDLKKAEEHFKKAWGGKAWDQGFKFTFSYNEGNNVRQIVASILKRGVERVNPKFKVDVRPIQWSTFLDRMNHHKLPLFMLGWNADYPDPHNFVFPLLHSKGNFPVAQGWKNAEVDALIEKAMSESDLGVRKALYSRVQQLEHDLAPHLVFVDSTKFRVQRKWVHGYIHNPIHSDSPWGGNFYPISKSE